MKIHGATHVALIFGKYYPFPEDTNLELRVYWNDFNGVRHCDVRRNWETHIEVQDFLPSKTPEKFRVHTYDVKKYYERYDIRHNNCDRLEWWQNRNIAIQWKNNHRSITPEGKKRLRELKLQRAEKLGLI